MKPPSPISSTPPSSPHALAYSSNDEPIKFEESYNPNRISEYVLEVCPELCGAPKSRPMWRYEHEGSSAYTNLVVSFPTDREDIQLETLRGPYWTDQLWEAKNTERLRDLPHIYKTELQLRSDITVKAILKFGVGNDDRDDLENEAEIYTTKLERAQTRLVPRFYGLFGCKRPRRKGKSGFEVTTCIVLSYIEGERITVPFSKLSAENRYALSGFNVSSSEFYRLKVFTTAVALHGCGVWHGDLHERNFILNDAREEAFVLDFGKSREHVCRHLPINVGDERPDQWQFGCSELHEIASRTVMWLDYGNAVYFH